MVSRWWCQGVGRVGAGKPTIDGESARYVAVLPTVMSGTMIANDTATLASASQLTRCTNDLSMVLCPPE